MSYFITVSGKKIDLSGLQPIELVPADKAQYYIKNLALELSALDGAPLFLVDDGSSGTSDDVVTPVISLLKRGGQIDETPFHRLLIHLSEHNCILRIWHASNISNAHLRVKDCNSLEDAIYEILEQSLKFAIIGIRVRFSCPLSLQNS
jgi:hypothetical protein